MAMHVLIEHLACTDQIVLATEGLHLAAQPRMGKSVFRIAGYLQLNY